MCWCCEWKSIVSQFNVFTHWTYSPTRFSPCPCACPQMVPGLMNCSTPMIPCVVGSLFCFLALGMCFSLLVAAEFFLGWVFVPGLGELEAASVKRRATAWAPEDPGTGFFLDGWRVFLVGSGLNLFSFNVAAVLVFLPPCLGGRPRCRLLAGSLSCCVEFVALFLSGLGGCPFTSVGCTRIKSGVSDTGIWRGCRFVLDQG